MKTTGNKRPGSGLVLGLLLGVGTIGWAEPGFSRPKPDREADASLRIAIRVRDYAGVRRGTLESAEEQTSRIFHKTRIEVTWVDCPLIAAKLDQYPACTRPTDSPLFDMNIVPHFMTTLYTTHEAAMGFASLSNEGARCFTATVFYDRVKDQAEDGMGSSAEILASVMAHELGHLLQRTTRHSSTGIMRARWTYGDFRQADCGHLLFTPQQADLMRIEVKERAKMQAAAEVATATTSQ